MKALLPGLLLSVAFTPGQAQILVDSIPYPDLSQGFWGIHVTPDTIFLGDDFSGDIYFSDHQGNILGQQSTGFDFNHGFIRGNGSYLIAEDYTTNGAPLYEIDNAGTLLNTWTFPDVIGGPSSGIGDLCADGNAIWYTMYYPDFDVYPYAYAYKWIPGDLAPIDTVPMLGEQPYGIALKGDTLLYVTDNLNGDPERIHGYDLTNEQNLGYVDLPDMATDGDQSPRGLFYDGAFLYLVANRQGGAANAYQTVFIYAFDDPSFVADRQTDHSFSLYPSPANEHVTISGLAPGSALEIIDLDGRRLMSTFVPSSRTLIRTAELSPGTYLVRSCTPSGAVSSRLLMIAR